MAREQRIAERSRLQVDAQETFDFTTPDIEVVTRPTDPYSQPAAGIGWQQLAQALSAINPALQGYAQSQLQQYEQDFEKGQLARATGKEKPSKSLGMIRGWETLDGIYKALQYKKEISDFYNQNYASLSPEEFGAALDEIEKRYLEGMTEWQQRGFVEKSLSAREQIEMAYINSQAQLIKQESLDKISQKAYDDVHSALLKGIEAAGISEEDAAGNPYFYQVVLDENNRKNLAAYIRAIITDTQNRIGKDLNLTKTEVAELYVQQLGELAVEYGLPELLDAAYIKESGISLEGSTLGDKVRRYREQATKAREAYLDAWTKQQKEQEQKELNELMIRTYQIQAQLSLMENPMEAAKQAYQWMLRMYEDPLYLSLDEADYHKLLKGFQDIAEGQFSFPDTSNDYVFVELKTKALQGTLSWQEVYDAMNSFELSRKDAEELMEMVAQIERIKAENEGKLPPWPDEKFVAPIRDRIIDYIGEQNALGVFQKGLDALAVETMFVQETYKFLQENGRFPTFTEWKEQIADRVLRFFELDFKTIMSAAGPNTIPPDLDDNLSVTRKKEAPWWQFWNWRKTETIELPFSYANQTVFNSLYNLFSSGVKLNTLREAIQNGTNDPSVSKLVQLFSQAGDPAEVAEGFFNYFRYAVVDYFLNQSDNDPLTAVEKAKTLLSEIGYSTNEINEAVRWVRYDVRREGGLVPNVTILGEE